jgi:hypothetical protein
MELRWTIQPKILYKENIHSIQVFLVDSIKNTAYLHYCVKLSLQMKVVAFVKMMPEEWSKNDNI